MKNMNRSLENYKKYLMKQYLIRIAAFIAITVSLVLLWRYYVHGYFSEKLNPVISYAIITYLIVFAFYKLKIWKIIIDRSFSGNILFIYKKTTLRDLHAENGRGFGFKDIVYEDTYTITIENNGRHINKAFVYRTNIPYDMPYKKGDSVIYYAGTKYPQFDDCMSDPKNFRKLCVWCGMPINPKDADDELCHFCHKGIIL